MIVPSKPLLVFCSFALEDEALCKQLRDHLRLLEREGMLTLWNQRLLAAGTDWAKDVDEQLARASIILLLISPAFLASDYYAGIEMHQAIQRHESGEARVLPVLLRPVDWTLAPFAHLSLLPSNHKAVTQWSNRDAAFTDIVTGLRSVIEELAPSSVGNVYRRTTSGTWNVPYQRNPHFTGRDDLLNQLQQQLSPETQGVPTLMRRAALTQPQAIKGLGGIGKTQIAVEYAYRAYEQGHYIHTLWINAANEETLITSFVGLAELLPAFPSKGETDQHKLVAAVKRWLEQCPQRWLLIFDNADDVSLIQEYFPSTGNGSILLTTRASAVGSLASSIEVETMSFVEGTHLLLRRAQRFEHASDEEINEAGNIVVALDHFPLALDQAGAYIDETQCSLADYLILYQSHRKELLARRGKQTTNYPDSVATTWSISFQKVEQANPAAAELLRLCAFLAPDHIPEELFSKGAAYWTPPLKQTATDLFAFNQMLQDLLAFSLVKRLTDDHLLSIHRLVQAVQIESMEPEEQHQWAERVIRAVNEMFPRDPKEEVATWPQCLRYLEQAQMCSTLIQQHMLLLPEAADVLDRVGLYLVEHASYDIAKPLYERALSIRERLLGPEHSDVATLLYHSAIPFYKQGKYAEAEPLYLRALGIWERQLGSEHPLVASTLNGLAVLNADQGKHAEAEPLYLRALRIWERQVDPERLEMAYTLNNLGNLYRDQGKYAEAEPLYRRSLKIQEQRLGPEHLQVAPPINNLGNFYREQGKYAEAEPLYQRALRIWEQQVGSEHPLVASSLSNLGLLYTEQGRYAEAEPLYLRVLRIREQQLGSEHPEIASIQNNLADLYRLQGKYSEAEALLKSACHIFEQVLGPNNRLVTYPLTGLAELFQKQGKYAEAEPLYQRALSIREQVFDPYHPNLANTLHGFASLREVQGNLKEATSLYQRALKIREQALGLHHPKTTETRERLQAMLAVTSQTEDIARLDIAQKEPET